MPAHDFDDTEMEFGPEALVFDRFGNPIYAPLPGEPIDEEGRPWRGGIDQDSAHEMWREA